MFHSSEHGVLKNYDVTTGSEGRKKRSGKLEGSNGRKWFNNWFGYGLTTGSEMVQQLVRKVGGPGRFEKVRKARRKKSALKQTSWCRVMIKTNSDNNCFYLRMTFLRLSISPPKSLPKAFPQTDT